MTDPAAALTRERDDWRRQWEAQFALDHSRIVRDEQEIEELRTALAAAQEREGRMREALALTAAILQAEKERLGGKPFTGTWTIPALDIRSTVSEALDKADAALAPAPQEGRE